MSASSTSATRSVRSSPAFCPRRNRSATKVIKKYDTAGTPYQRVLADETVTKKVKVTLTPPRSRAS